MSDDAPREAFLAAIMSRRDCDRAEAEVIMERTVDRLDGYSHAEAVARHPLPPGRDEACGTAA